jgi:hypothetical protein
VDLFGVDVEPKQLAFARRHSSGGVEATLVEADALALPFEDESFDHVWMMWFLEHRRSALSAPRAPACSCRAARSQRSRSITRRAAPSVDARLRSADNRDGSGMAASGWSDAGTRLPDWLREAGFRDVEEGERPFWWQGADAAREAHYAANVMDSAVAALVQLPGVDVADIRAGLADLRELPNRRGAGLGWVVHKSKAVR